MLFNVFKILSEEQLRNLDEEIRCEILPYIKQFESLSNIIQKQAIAKANSLTSQQYFIELSKAWTEHNKAAHEIDFFLYALLTERATIEQNIHKTKKLVALAFDSEEIKRILSAGVKNALDRYEQEMQNQGLSEDEILLVLTPKKNLWTSYYHDHLKFLFSQSLKQEKSVNLKDELVSKYHAKSEAIFNQRLQSSFQNESSWSSDKLKKVIDNYEASQKNDATESFQSISIRYSEANHINDLASYDNYEEYLFGYNYYGYPDFLLRKVVINFLISKNLIDKRNSILMYSKSEILMALEKVNLPEINFSRSDNNQPQVFLQTTPTTCGVACMMMGLNFFTGTPLTKPFESKLRKKLKLKRYDLVPAMNLAIYMQQQGLSINIYHQDSFKFWNFIKEINQDIYEQQKEILDYASKVGLKPLDKEITPQIIKDFINQGFLIIMGIELSYDIKHAILIFGYNKNIFSIIDPLSGKREYLDSKLMEESNMNTGRWFIAFNYRDYSPINNN